jgi:hypothetical protein
LETVAHAVLSGLIGTPMPSHAEILVIPRESIDAVGASIPASALPDLVEYRAKAPSSAEVAGWSDDTWLAARDGNLDALAHYVLSLSRRDRVAFRLFRKEPELEGRAP